MEIPRPTYIPQASSTFRDEGFILSSDDLVLLRWVFNYRYARIDDLADLTGRGYKKVQERMVKLAERKYLWRKRVPFRKHVYGIGTNGIAILVGQGFAPKEELTKRLRHHELTNLYLDHTLMIVDIRKHLELATRESALKLINWQDGRHLRDRVSVFERGQEQKLTVWPDGFFILEDSRRPQGQNRARFFLEADRSSTAHRKFQQKVLGFWKYLDSGQYTKRYRSRSFRVVTVTLTQWRARELCRATAEALPEKARRFFLFTSLVDLPMNDPSAILKDVFVSAGDHQSNRRHFLVPPF